MLSNVFIHHKHLLKTKYIEQLLGLSKILQFNTNKTNVYQQ